MGGVRSPPWPLEAPALVVLDLMLPEVDGLAVIRAVRRTAPTPIIVLSARGGNRRPHRRPCRGRRRLPAQAVLTSGAGAPRTARPRAHRARWSEGRPGAGARCDMATSSSMPPVTRSRSAGRPVAVTAVEFRLLAALLEAGGRVLSRDQLLDAVYGRGEVGVMDRTIDAHVRRLREKLGDDPDHPRYVATVRGVGYRAAPPMAEL